MPEDNTLKKSYIDKKLDGNSKKVFVNCGVLAGQFPCMEKCYSKSESILGIVYNKNCIHCSIWASLPEGTSLAIQYIFSCSLYGYDKRIK